MLVMQTGLLFLGSAARAQPTSDPSVPGAEATWKQEGTIFGEPIQAKKLGVMIDVSGSTHPYLLGALTEVNRSFSGMPTVLVFGCGAKESIKPGDFSIQSALQAQKEYESHVRLLVSDLSQSEKKRLEESVFGQVAKACQAPRQSLSQYISQLLKQPNVYWSIASKEVNPRFGSAQAMEFLSSQGVDTIYWFSDCNDIFEMPAAASVSQKLKLKGVRVIAHNFSGVDDPKVNPGVPAAKMIVEETGGQYISKKIQSK